MGIDNIEEFQLVMVNDEWRITNTILFPRISLDLTIAHDQDLLNGYKKSEDTQTVERLEKSLMRLYRMKTYEGGVSSN